MADTRLGQLSDKEIRALVLSKVIGIVMVSPYQIPVPLRHNFAMKALDWKLLRVSKSVHVEAHQVFFAANTFFLTQTGSVVDQQGLKGLTCSICCAQSEFKFETGLVYLGHNHNANVAFTTINDTIRLFKTPATPVTFKHLTIDVKFFYFGTETQIRRFIRSLRRVQVTDRLTITGLDIHVQGWMRDVAEALMMRFEPVDFEMEMRDPESGTFEPFRAEYVPATSRRDMFSGLEMAGDLIDPVKMLTQYMNMAVSLGDNRYDFSAQVVLRR